MQKNRQKGDCAVYARMATAWKACRLATASASGCRACGSWETGTTSWKSRSKMELTASFQLVENRIE